jgi:hypothetical protein
MPASERLYFSENELAPLVPECPTPPVQKIVRMPAAMKPQKRLRDEEQLASFQGLTIVEKRQSVLRSIEGLPEYEREFMKTMLQRKFGVCGVIRANEVELLDIYRQIHELKQWPLQRREKLHVRLGVKLEEMSDDKVELVFRKIRDEVIADGQVDIDMCNVQELEMLENLVEERDDQ